MYKQLEVWSTVEFKTKFPDEKTKWQIKKVVGNIPQHCNQLI